MCRFALRLFRLVGLLAVSQPTAHSADSPKVHPQAGNGLAVRQQVARRLAESVDVGDSYLTPKGRQSLRRLAGAVVLRFTQPEKRSELLQALTGEGGPLAGYVTDFNVGKEAVVVRAPAAERQRQMGEIGRLHQALAAARSWPDVRSAEPLFIHPVSGLWLAPTADIIVRLRDGVSPDAYFGQRLAPKRVGGTTDQYILSLGKATAEQMLAEVNRHAADRRVVWVQPDFISQEIKHINDPLYALQWHLNNTGQSGALINADINAPEAWTMTTGKTNIVIAILDDAIQISHPDLNANIFTNSADLANGVDDDNNGYIDDTRGWDFTSNDNNPSPDQADESHGTQTAGIAAAVGNNNLGVASAAYSCRILPVKGADLTDSQRAETFYYAAGRAKNGVGRWRGADLISFSIGRAPSQVVDDALHWAATSGRGGAGCAIFVSSGNDASGWGRTCVTIPTPGMHTVRWEYVKDVSDRACEDRVWLDSVMYTDGTVETFETPGLPLGWSSGGFAPWINVQNGIGGHHAVTGWNGPNSRALASGVIFDDEYTYVQVTRNMPAGDLFYFVWVGSEEDFDTLDIYLDGIYQYSFSGCLPIDTAVGYPANHPDTIAVGASTDFDYRADFSQYGTDLDFVAPGGGGRRGLYTTDRTGASGDVAGDYQPDFEGTSASCPLAASVGALVLSVNPALTATELRGILRAGCDKIGDVTYNGNGWNAFYGYGRLNAERSVRSALIRITEARAIGADFRISFTTLATRSYRVERSAILGPNAIWATVLGAANVPGTGGVVQITETGGAMPPTHFYRVRQL